LRQFSDLVVVGAGPAGCAAAIAAAKSGVAVTLLDKAGFPRAKVCGDALTPRAVAALASLGVAVPAQAHLVRGLMVYGLGADTSRFDWPATSGLPDVGYTCPRADLDAALLDAAIAAGASVHLGQAVTGLRLEGVRAGGVVTADGAEWRAPVVVDASGASSRLGDAIGLPRVRSRPMGVAVRGYMRGAGDDQWLHSWLAIANTHGVSLPGYGWVFPMGGGLFNVGIGQLSTSPSFRTTNYRQLLLDWVAGLPVEWGLEGASAIGGAALPMGIDRAALYRRGLLLAGDAAGLVNPFNGEGVSYALQSGLAAGRAAARAVQAGCGTAAAEAALQGYHHAIKGAFGHYFTAGNMFADLMGHPLVLNTCLRYGLPRPAVMRPVNKLMANLMAARGGPIGDRVTRILLSGVRLVHCREIHGKGPFFGFFP